MLEVEGCYELCSESLPLPPGRAQSSGTLRPTPSPWGLSSSQGLFASSFPTGRPHRIVTLPSRWLLWPQLERRSRDALE